MSHQVLLRYEFSHRLYIQADSCLLVYPPLCVLQGVVGGLCIQSTIRAFFRCLYDSDPCLPQEARVEEGNRGERGVENSNHVIAITFQITFHLHPLYSLYGLIELLQLGNSEI